MLLNNQFENAKTLPFFIRLNFNYSLRYVNRILKMLLNTSVQAVQAVRAVLAVDTTVHPRMALGAHNTACDREKFSIHISCVILRLGDLGNYNLRI